MLNKDQLFVIKKLIFKMLRIPYKSWPFQEKRKMGGTKNPLLKVVANIDRDPATNEYAKATGLVVTSVSWEDTGRDKGSSVGPNISDMTLEVDGTRMPMIRRPNFGDVTCDTPIDMHMVKVGNEKGEDLKEIPLRVLLEKLGLWLERDSSILSSTQACILPLSDGKVEFAVKLFNYQSDEEDPAVLVIVASDQGTSVMPITEYQQSLFFNKNGMSANFLAQRLADFRAETGSGATGAMTAEEAEKNMLRVYQVPLKQTKPRRPMYMLESCCMSACAMSVPKSVGTRGRGFDDAILSTGEGFAPFHGVGDRKLIRDERFPIRCTYQYYKVTDTDKVSYDLMHEIQVQLNRLYEEAERRGSLVVETTDRKTEPQLTSKLVGSVGIEPCVYPSGGLVQYDDGSYMILE